MTNRDFGPNPPALTDADPAGGIPEREQLARELYPHLPNRYPVEWDQLPTSYARRLLTAVEKALLPKLVGLRHQVANLVQDKHDLCRRLLVTEHAAERLREDLRERDEAFEDGVRKGQREERDRFTAEVVEWLLKTFGVRSYIQAAERYTAACRDRDESRTALVALHDLVRLQTEERNSDLSWRVLVEVADERGRQRRKWGVQEAPAAVWMTILGEEFGEACREVLAMRGGHRPDGVSDPAADARLRVELVQLAAVAVQTVEALDRAGEVAHG